MSIVWIWNMACFMMDIISYFMSCFRVGHSDDGENEDRKKRQKHDQDYFKSYAGICVHEEMLSDTVRTNAYRYAILKNYEKIRGKIVADIGAGTGILSVFCVQAGAKKEASDMAKQTQANVDEKKCQTELSSFSVMRQNVQAHAVQVCRLNLNTATKDYLQNVKKEFTFHCFGQSTIHGFTTWFDVGFPESITLTTSPYAEETHWSQTLF
ncbi:protein arginine N-methyltransferase 6-like [Ruditapes philippinarum]|uniref:protein arginine N-methyltransferase 6-like n=1 Tax=Ruditapes philippinarum TaxID=129788 RepID=UPI00295B05F0|nr:protein arginine N-methyltransferase 6-like [Ruditapes philippinarum]